MKPHQIYDELKLLAERLGIVVSEQNFRTTGVKAKSGLCRVRGKMMFIMDKHHSVKKKNAILSRCLKKMDHEDIYLVPAVREFLGKE